jgi:hypothetical protein
VLNKIIDMLIKYYETNKDENIIKELFNYCKEINQTDINGVYGFYIFYDIIAFIREINLVGLDLYFLTRSFKKPEGSEKPLVSFGYFGVVHSRNIKHFLLNIMGNYTDNYTEDNSTKEPNRCLKITKNINLDKIMENYKSL